MRSAPDGTAISGSGEYQVLGVARHSETEKGYVVYRAPYRAGGLWVRPASMWCEVLERDGVQVPRFACLEEE